MFSILQMPKIVFYLLKYPVRTYLFFKGKISLISTIFISLLYILLCHLTIAHSSTSIVDNKYFVIKIFEVFDFHIYLSLFAWLKSQALIHLFEMNFLTHTFESFNLYSGYDPHSLFSSILFFVTPLGLIAFIIFLTKIFSLHIKTFEKGDIIYNVVFIVFFIESIVWDSFDSPLFWLIILIV